MIFGKRWEVWVHYRRGPNADSTDPIIKSRLLATHRLRWWARMCHESVVDAGGLASVMDTYGPDGYLTWPEIDIVDRASEERE